MPPGVTLRYGHWRETHRWVDIDFSEAFNARRLAPMAYDGGNSSAGVSTYVPPQLSIPDIEMAGVGNTEDPAETEDAPLLAAEPPAAAAVQPALTRNPEAKPKAEPKGPASGQAQGRAQGQAWA